MKEILKTIKDVPFLTQEEQDAVLDKMKVLKIKKKDQALLIGVKKGAYLARRKSNKVPRMLLVICDLCDRSEKLKKYEQI